MKKFQFSFFAVLLMMTVFLSSCELVGDIFKAGFWSAFILIGLLIVVIIFIANRLGGKNNKG